MDELPFELIQHILGFVDKVRTLISLKLASVNLNQNVSALIRKKSTCSSFTPDCFKMMQIVDNIRASFENMPKFYYMSNTVQISNCLSLNVGAFYDKKPYMIFLKISNVKKQMVKLFENTNHLIIDKCHYLTTKHQIIIHSFSHVIVESESYHTDMIVDLWPNIKCQEILVKTTIKNLYYFPFCYKCHCLYPEMDVRCLPLTNSYRTIRITIDDIWYTDCETLNQRSLAIYSFKQQMKINLVSSIMTLLNFREMIRVVKFFQDFAIVGIWDRSIKRRYELYHIKSFSNIHRYSVKYTKGGLGVVKDVVSVNLDTSELVFISRNKFRYTTKIFPVN